jgi:Josephin
MRDFNLVLVIVNAVFEGPSNGGLLYHEVHEGKCVVHCANTVSQGPYFSELDLIVLASDLDKQERQVLMQGRDLSSEQEGIGGVGPEGGFARCTSTKGVELQSSRSGECIHMPLEGSLVLCSQDQ